MPPTTDNNSLSRVSNPAWKLTGVYLLFGVLWIIFSDTILAHFVTDPARMTRLQTYKGWFYVSITAVLMYALITYGFRAIQKSHHRTAVSESRYRAIVETSHAGIALTDMHGKMILANERLAEIVDRAHHFLIGQSIPELLRQASGKELLPEPDDWRSHKQFDLTLKHTDGALVHVLATLCPIFDDRDSFAGAMIVLNDITERKRLQDELHQAQKMEAIGQLAGGVAHDFNNLLTAIYGYTDLAQATLPDEHPARESLNNVTEIAKQAAGVSQALLTFSRKSSGVMAPVDLNEVIAKSTRILQRVLPASIRVALECQADENLLILADEIQMQQVIMNLAINARDAMPDGGTITITSRSNPPETSLPGPEQVAAPYVQISVGDTGQGIAPEIQPHIFEPFFTTKPKGVGTGLGLSILHGIVRDHKGRITFDTGLDRGTTFYVRFPAVHKENIEHVAPTSDIAPRGQGELVVLAEDNDHIRQLVGVALKNQGYDVTEVANGELLLDLIDHYGNDIRVVIMDIDMPLIDGINCLHTIRHKGLTTPVILVTGSGREIPEKQLDSNTVLLRKPFQIVTLNQLIADMLKGS